MTQRAVSKFLAPQKHGARQNHGCVNPSFSRILTRTRFAPYALGQAQLPRKPARPYALLVLHRLVGWLFDPSSYFCGYGLTYSAASFLGGLATWFGMRTNSAVGCPRIARGVPWAGSVTGGEACQNPCSEKEGFTHPWLWRAPCFWGTHEWELHAVDT